MQVTVSKDEYDELCKDKARLDFLESAHHALNAHYGTVYNWRLIINHNVIRAMAGHSHPCDGFPGIDLHDSEGGNIGVETCRDAIDAVREVVHDG